MSIILKEPIILDLRVWINLVVTRALRAIWSKWSFALWECSLLVGVSSRDRHGFQEKHHLICRLLDEIEYVDGKSSLKNVVGGAGSYAAFGARLVAGVAHSRSVGWVVDAGSDFPLDIRRILESWQTNCLFREDESRLTTRAWNGYGYGRREHRGREHRRYGNLMV